MANEYDPNSVPLSQIMKTDRTAAEDEMPVARAETPVVNENMLFQQATGLRVDPSTIAPAPAPTQRVLTPDEAAQFDSAEKIDVDKELMEARNRKADEMLAQPKNDMLNLIKEAEVAEEERVQRHDEALSDEDTRKAILGDDPAINGGKVKYVAPIDAETVTADAPAEAPKKDNTVYDYTDSTPKFAQSVAEEVDDLIPSYEYNEDDTPPEAEAEKPEDKRPVAADDSAEYSKYLKTLDVITPESDSKPIPVVVKEKSLMEAVPSGRVSKTKVLGDQAFLNSVTKFKKDNFRTVSVPLVNSGFCADIVGTGAVDLSLLYNEVDQNILPVDYELEKMRVIFRNITGTDPKIDRNDLRNLIHFNDYQMLAYGHLVATLKEVEIVHTCEECGSDFRIVANSSDLILNLPEMRDRMNEIKAATSIQQYSLMVNNRKMTTDSGFTIMLGHPSYADYIQYLAEVKELTTTLSKAQSARLTSMITMLPFVRSVVMPNQVHTTNLYQRFTAICLLSTDEFNELEKETERLSREILSPKFGIKKVVCPHCKKVNADIEYQNLNDLLFFHFMVIQLLNRTEQ